MKVLAKLYPTLILKALKKKFRDFQYPGNCWWQNSAQENLVRKKLIALPNLPEPWDAGIQISCEVDSLFGDWTILNFILESVRILSLKI